MNARPKVYLFFICALGAWHCALDGMAQERTRATAIIFSTGNLAREELTQIDIGLRHGMRKRDGLRYVYVADALSVDAADQELAEALDLLDEIGVDIQAAPWPQQYKRANSVVTTLRANLSLVKRSDIARAMAYQAVAACALGRDEECERILRDVYTFRMDFRPEEHGVPPRFVPEFEKVLREVQISPLHFVTIDTVPTGLEVFVDGRSQGVAPVEVDMSSGLHFLTARGFGYDKYVKEVRIEGPSRHVLEPAQSERALLIDKERDGLLAEMGSERAGSITAGMASYLSVSQVVVGRVGPEMELELWLYDLRTKVLLSTVAGPLQAEQLADDATLLGKRLYEGVDLGGALAFEESSPEEGDSIFEQWWFWTGIGAVVVGGTITAIALASGSDPDVPEGMLRLMPRLD